MHAEYMNLELKTEDLQYVSRLCYTRIRVCGRYEKREKHDREDDGDAWLSLLAHVVEVATSWRRLSFSSLTDHRLLKK